LSAEDIININRLLLTVKTRGIRDLDDRQVRAQIFISVLSMFGKTYSKSRYVYLKSCFKGHDFKKHERNSIENAIRIARRRKKTIITDCNSFVKATESENESDDHRIATRLDPKFR